MHQLCFDIHHLVLTTAKKRQPARRRHRRGDIMRGIYSGHKVLKGLQILCLRARVRVCLCGFGPVNRTQ